MKESELELLKLAQDKNSEAVDTLLFDYKHLVTSIARKYFLIGGDKEDLIQEGMIGLFKAIGSFDTSKNDNFSGYAVMLIEREIISAIRRASSGGQQMLSKSIFVENDDELGDSVCPETEFMDAESTSALTSEIFDKLSGFEKIVADYYLKGYQPFGIEMNTKK